MSALKNGTEHEHEIIDTYTDASGPASESSRPLARSLGRSGGHFCSFSFRSISKEDEAFARTSWSRARHHRQGIFSASCERSVIHKVTMAFYLSICHFSLALSIMPALSPPSPPIPAGVGNKKFEIIWPLNGTLTEYDAYEVENHVFHQEKNVD